MKYFVSSVFFLALITGAAVAAPSDAKVRDLALAMQNNAVQEDTADMNVSAVSTTPEMPGLDTTSTIFSTGMNAENPALTNEVQTSALNISTNLDSTSDIPIDDTHDHDCQCIGILQIDPPEDLVVDPNGH